MSQIIDISPLIFEGCATWPGEQPFSRKVNLSMAHGSNIDLSSYETTVHIGAHADSRSHYLKDGKTIDQMKLDPYWGPCQVIEVNVNRSERIQPGHIKTEIDSPRVLFKTGTFPDFTNFNTDFASLSSELVNFLSEKKCVLIGIDTPSVDLYDDKVLESHKALAKTGLVNLEGLVLKDVEPGHYELAALPLKIKGGDAGPTRAALRKIRPHF
jgi:arylformamidase